MRKAGLSLLAALLAARCATVTIEETHFFHPGPAQGSAPAAIDGATIEGVTLDAADGTNLGGAYITRPDADVEVLYFGGNVSRVDDVLAPLFEEMRTLRANVLMIDYRGYGRSAGTPAIDTAKSDGMVAFDHLRTRSSRPIVVHGFSLGSFIAAAVAAERQADGLVLEATAPDVATWARHQIPLYAKPVVRLNIAPKLLAESNVAAVKRHAGPLLLVTGSRDPVTPPRFLQALLAASPSTDKRAVVAEGATHGDALAVPAARQAYAEFLDVVRARSGK